MNTRASWTNSGPGHGFGKLTSKTETYIGEWERGERVGYGKLIFERLETENPAYVYEVEFEGTFQNDYRQGYGKSVYTGGGEYVGEWNFDQKHGYGKDIFANGHYYEGQYKDGLFH